MSGILTFLIGAIAGGIVQLALAILFEDSFRLYYRKIRAKALFVTTLLRSGEMRSDNDFYNVGDFRVTCIVLEGTARESLLSENLSATLSDKPLVLPPDLDAVLQATTQRQKQIAASRGHPTFFNGPMVALEGWSRSRTAGTERDVLALRFISTDYYTFLSTAMSLNESVDLESGPATIRDLYVSGRDYRKPNPVIATSFGINLAVITSDRFTMLARRGTAGLSNYSGRMAVPVGESVQPDFDRSGVSEISLFDTAMRGAREELNLDIVQSEIAFYSLAVDTTWYFYGLTGAIFCSKYSRDDVIAHRSVGAKDKWEHGDIAFVKFDPTSVARYLRDMGGVFQLTPFSFVSLTQALMATYGEMSVMNAFKKIR